MSIELLKNLDQEVHRLLIAGSKLAAGDLRLGKLQAQLRKLGEASPVFARVAQAVEMTMEVKQDSSAEKLLELAALVQSILYTQGQTETREELTTLAGSAHFHTTQTAFRRLNPVMNALLHKGQGRAEIIREAYEEGVFRDYRLLLPAITALDDAYAEIPELIESKVIPGFGADALPILKRQLRMDGGKGDARRLRLIHRILEEKGMELYMQAANEGSLEVKIAAIELLGHYAEHEGFLLEQSKERRKDVRRTALIALAKLGTARSSDRILEALASKDREFAVESAVLSTDEQLVHGLIEWAGSVFTKLKQGQMDEETLDQLNCSLKALEGRQGLDVFELLKALLTDPAFIVRGTERVQETALQLLIDLEAPDARAFAVSLKHQPHSSFLRYSFIAALRSLSPQEVYEQYGGYLKGSNKTAVKTITNILDRVAPRIARKLVNSDGDSSFELDGRWAYDCMELDEAELVCRLAHTNDKQTVSYLTAICKDESSKAFRRYYNEALLALFYIGYKEAPELLKSIYTPERVDNMYYLNYEQVLLLGMLPPSYADWLAAFTQDLGLSDSMRNRFAEIADAVRTKPTEDKDDQRGWIQWLMDKMR